MFYGASAFNQPLEQWNVVNVTTMHSMFLHANAFKQDISNWNVSNGPNMDAMFNQDYNPDYKPGVERSNFEIVIGNINQQRNKKIKEIRDEREQIGQEPLTSVEMENYYIGMSPMEQVFLNRYGPEKVIKKSLSGKKGRTTRKKGRKTKSKTKKQSKKHKTKKNKKTKK
tara:strand:- start:39 stop:545 length:507 start_codon:yes stop_codon:yes gene_type:complete